jgi:hypothetical protein
MLVEALVSADSWRHDRLYTREVDELLVHHTDWLQVFVKAG